MTTTTYKGTAKHSFTSKTEKKQYRKDRIRNFNQYRKTLQVASFYEPSYLKMKKLEKHERQVFKIESTTFRTFKSININPMTGNMKERKEKYKKSIESSDINEYTLSENELSSYQTDNETDSNRSYDYLTGLEQYDSLVGFLLYRSRITTMFRTSADLKVTEWNDLKSEAVTICYELISEGFTLESEAVESIAIEKDKEPHQVWINEAGKRLQNYINNQVFSSVKTSMRVLKKEALKEEENNKKPLSRYQLHLIDTAKQLLHGNVDIYDEGMKDFMDSLTDSEKKYVAYKLGYGKRYTINNRGRLNIHEKLKKAIFS